MDPVQSSLRTPAFRRYMSKSQRACDFCRSRKSACLIENGLPCRLCKLHGRDCTFNSSARQTRKIPPTTASTSALIEDWPVHINQSPSPKSRTGGADVSENPQITGREAEVRMDSFGDDVYMEVVAQIQQQSEQSDAFLLDAFAAQEDLFLPLELDILSDMQYAPDQSVQEDSEVSPAMAESLDFAPLSPSASRLRSSTTSRIIEECALTGDMDPYLMRHHVYDSSGTFVSKRLAIHSVSDGRHPIHFLSFPTSSQEDSRHRLELESIVNPEIGKRLIDLFFRFVFPQLPIFNLAVPPETSKSPPCLLAAIYLITEAFSNFDDYLCIQTVYEASAAKQLRDIAFEALNSEKDEPHIALLQTLLIMIMAPPENAVMPENRARWSLVGDAVTMSQTLGLEHDPSSWRLEEEEIQLRRRLAWCVRFADTWLAASLGKYPLITDNNWLVQPPTKIDFTDAENSTGKIELFICFASLTQVMADIMSNLFSLRAVQSLSADFRHTLRTSNPLMARLSQWYDTLPTQTGQDIDSDFDVWGIAHLGYHFAKVLIYRAIFRPFHNLDNGSISHTEDATGEREALDHLKVAAKRSQAVFTTFVSQLTNQHFNAFWPFWSFAPWAALANLRLLLFITARSDDEAREEKKSLDQVRRALRMQSKSFSVLSFALLRLDSVYWKGFENVFRLSPQVKRACQTG